MLPDLSGVFPEGKFSKVYIGLLDWRRGTKTHSTSFMPDNKGRLKNSTSDFGKLYLRQVAFFVAWGGKVSFRSGSELRKGE